MATAVRRHSIVNPAGHRRKHMSAKQIRHFGTKRQKAALKARSKSNRPKANRRSAHRARNRPRQSNPGEILSLTLGNPARKKRKMAKTNRKRSHRTNASHHRRRRMNARRNPAKTMQNRRRRRTNVRHHRRRNSGVMRRNPGGREVTNLAIEAVAALGGFVGSRWLTQLVLAANNTGVMGYVGNAAATALLGVAAHFAMPSNKSVRDGVILGGTMGIVARVVEDYTPIGSALTAQGIGDYGMAAYMPTNQVVPQRYVNAWQSAQVQIPPGWGGGTSMVPAGAAAAGMSGLGDLYGDGGFSLY